MTDPNSKRSILLDREAECREWIESCGSDKIVTLQGALQDGVMLCKLANIVMPDCIRKYNKNPKSTALKLENIENFLKVCSTRFFIADEDLFPSILLVEGGQKQMAPVIRVILFLRDYHNANLRQQQIEKDKLKAERALDKSRKSLLFSKDKIRVSDKPEPEGNEKKDDSTNADRAEAPNSTTTPSSSTQATTEMKSNGSSNNLAQSAKDSSNSNKSSAKLEASNEPQSPHVSNTNLASSTASTSSTLSPSSSKLGESGSKSSQKISNSSKQKNQASSSSEPGSPRGEKKKKEKDVKDKPKEGKGQLEAIKELFSPGRNKNKTQPASPNANVPVIPNNPTLDEPLALIETGVLAWIETALGEKLALWPHHANVAHQQATPSTAADTTTSPSSTQQTSSVRQFRTVIFSDGGVTLCRLLCALKPSAVEYNRSTFGPLTQEEIHHNLQLFVTYLHVYYHIPYSLLFTIDDYTLRPNLDVSYRKVLNDLMFMRAVEQGHSTGFSCFATTFYEHVKDPDGKRMFEEFLEYEYARENIDFYFTIENYRTLQTEAELKEGALAIFENFLKTNSKNMININSEHHKHVRALIEHDAYTNDMFDSCQREICGFLEKDKWGRYQLSSYFAKYLWKKDLLLDKTWEQWKHFTKKESALIRSQKNLVTSEFSALDQSACNIESNFKNIPRANRTKRMDSDELVLRKSAQSSPQQTSQHSITITSASTSPTATKSDGESRKNEKSAKNEKSEKHEKQAKEKDGESHSPGSPRRLLKKQSSTSDVHKNTKAGKVDAKTAAKQQPEEAKSYKIATSEDLENQLEFSTNHKQKRSEKASEEPLLLFKMPGGVSPPPSRRTNNEPVDDDGDPLLNFKKSAPVANPSPTNNNSENGASENGPASNQAQKQQQASGESQPSPKLQWSARKEPSGFNVLPYGPLSDLASPRSKASIGRDLDPARASLRLSTQLTVELLALGGPVADAGDEKCPETSPGYFAHHEQPLSLSLSSKSKQQHQVESNPEARRILLCGLDNAGKSTFLKQLFDFFKKHTPACDVGLTHEMLVSYFPFLAATQAESLEKVRALFLGEIQRMLEYLQPFFQEYDALFTAALQETSLNERVVQHVTRLWGVEKIRDAVQRLELVKVPGYLVFSPYYFEQIDRVCAPDFVPTWDDCVRVSASPTVEPASLEIRDYRQQSFTFVDVGGLPEELSKWDQEIESGLDALFYFFPLNGYNDTDMLIESVKKWRALRQTLKIPCYLIFTKYDLFQKKIPRFPLNEVFKSYESSVPGEDYIAKKFQLPSSPLPFLRSADYYVMDALSRDSCRETITTLLDSLAASANLLKSNNSS